MNLVERLLTEIGKRRKRVVVIGDVMVDRWIHGNVATCQDDCPKFVIGSIVEVPGGAANAERCISNWGINTSLYGFSSNDCPVKTRYVEGDKIVFRADDEGSPERGTKYDWARKLAQEMMQSAAAVLLSDYDKGFLTRKFIAEIAERCSQRNIPCVADCKREPSLYAGCVIKGNCEWKDRHIGNIPEPFVVTNGMCAPDVWSEDTEPYTCDDLRPVPCVNHVGAGDCFAAHLTLALAYGFFLKDAAALAHSAGRVYIQYPHNRPPTPSEITADLSAG